MMINFILLDSSKTNCMEFERLYEKTKSDYLRLKNIDQYGGVIRKKEFDVTNVRRFLEPGPIILISSKWKGKTNIMTMGWYMIEETDPSLVICYVWDQNFSRKLIEKSGGCVINIPTVDIEEKVVKIGNVHGNEIDKFKVFGLTPIKSKKVKAPSIKECFANFECRVFDDSLLKKYNLFVFKVVHAKIQTKPEFPKTIHYRGDGLFMISGKTTDRLKKYFKPEMLE